MRIRTSYFSNLKAVIAANMVPVSISCFTPEWFTGECLPMLAPTPALLNAWKSGLIDRELYKMLYLKELEKLDFSDLMKRLESIALKNRNERLCFLCYEKPDAFCHRHLLSEWLNKQGISSREFVSKQNAVLQFELAF